MDAEVVGSRCDPLNSTKRVECVSHADEKQWISWRESGVPRWESGRSREAPSSRWTGEYAAANATDVGG